MQPRKRLFTRQVQTPIKALVECDSFVSTNRPASLTGFVFLERWVKVFYHREGILRRAVFFAVLSCCVALTAFHAQGQKTTQQVSLPTSKVLSVPSPGVLGPLNGFAAAIVISPDHRYAAILNNGYGTQRAQAHQSIGIIDLSTNQISDFPEERLPEDAHQSYFVGLEFSGDGKHLYASVGSVTDPLGEKKGDTGNGIAVYSFAQGKVTWERFLKIAPQPIAQRKKIADGLRKTGETTVLPYPAGLNVISGHGKDPETILVANNYSDNVVLLDPADGRVLKQFDLSTHDMIPSSFPYTVVASPDGRRAWCSLWNASRVAELDLEKGTVIRWIPLLEPKDPIAPGSHPTAMQLSPDGKSLYVALANADRVAVISADTGEPQMWFDTRIPGQKFAGTFPSALALSSDGKQLFVADASVNAVAVFPTHPTVANSGGLSANPVQPASGFIPTDWYPTALATTGNDLLIATSKGREPARIAASALSSTSADTASILIFLHCSMARLRGSLFRTSTNSCQTLLCACRRAICCTRIQPRFISQENRIRSTTQSTSSKRIVLTTRSSAT